MGWQQIPRYLAYGPTARQHLIQPLNVNEQCFIRKAHKCGKIFGASKSCFIACPTDDEIEPILELMSEKVSKVGIEPIIAVKERAYGQDIFCTKICGKIIESRFCVVILNDTITDAKNIPNPNVYYEYGLMTSLRKHIIPLQKDNLKLAFNIQSYDTIKYNSRNIASELDRGIKDAVRITESREKEEKKTYFSEKTILRKLELAGFQLKDREWFLSDVIDDTDFKGFGQYEKRFYLYLAKIDDTAEFQTHLEDLDVILYRTERKAQELDGQLSERIRQKKELLKQKKDEQDSKDKRRIPIRRGFWERELKDTEEGIRDKKSKKELMSKIFVGFVTNPQLDATAFIDKVHALINEYHRYKVSHNTGGKIVFDDITLSIETPGY